MYSCIIESVFSCLDHWPPLRALAVKVFRSGMKIWNMAAAAVGGKVPVIDVSRPCPFAPHLVTSAFAGSHCLLGFRVSPQSEVLSALKLLSAELGVPQGLKQDIVQVV